MNAQKNLLLDLFLSNYERMLVELDFVHIDNPNYSKNLTIKSLRWQLLNKQKKKICPRRD